MSEEEKKAIDEFKKELRLAKNIDDITTSIRNEYAETIVNLINNQQKEIEELKKENEEQWRKMCKMTIELDNNVISKDKIRETIKELEQIQNTALTGTTVEIMDYKITILKQLLEE